MRVAKCDMPPNHHFVEERGGAHEGPDTPMLASLVFFSSLVIGTALAMRLCGRYCCLHRTATAPGPEEASGVDEASAEEVDKMFSSPTHVLVELPDRSVCAGVPTQVTGPATAVAVC